jgi:hypothetical protein
MREKKYLVGVKTRANIPNGSTESRCKMGKANAIVFPEPVFAFPMQSLPWIQIRTSTDVGDHSFGDLPARRGGIQAV